MYVLFMLAYYRVDLSLYLKTSINYHWLSLSEVISNPLHLVLPILKGLLFLTLLRLHFALGPKLLLTWSLHILCNIAHCMHAWANGALESGGGWPCQQSDAKLINWVWYHTDAAILLPRPNLVTWHSAMPCRQTSLGMCWLRISALHAVAQCRHAVWSFTKGYAHP